MHPLPIGGLLSMKFPLGRKRFSCSVGMVVSTRGSRGLGVLLARQLRREGARVALLACNLEELLRAQDQLGAGSWLLSIPCDVADRALVQQAIEIVIHHYGRID